MRLKEIDVMRGAAFCMVVAQHTIGGCSFSDKATFSDVLVLRFLYTIAKTAVPIFVAITGISLFLTYKDKFPVKKFYVKRAKGILVPYVSWTIICMILLKNTDRFKNFFEQLAAGNGGFHLWYMGMTIRLYIYFPLIWLVVTFIHKRNSFIRKTAFLAYMVFSFYLFRRSSAFTEWLGKLVFGNPTEVQQRIANISPLPWMFYLVIGACMIYNYDKLRSFLMKHYKGVFGIYGIMFMHSYYGEIAENLGNPITWYKSGLYSSVAYDVMSIFALLTLALVIVEKHEAICSAACFLGEHSFPAYMAHVIVIQKLAERMSFSSLTSRGLILFLLTVSITPALCWAMSYLPFNQLLLGKKYKRYEWSFGRKSLSQ